jgi:hypothetical protein
MKFTIPFTKVFGRPAELEKLSFFELYCRGQWKLCDCENLRLFGHILYLTMMALIGRNFIVLRFFSLLVHRDLNALTENNSVSWSDLFERYRNAPSDLLGPVWIP